MKTSELSGAALDWAVAKCEGDREANDSDKYDDWDLLPYSTDWSQGGPIIESEGIGILFDSGSICRKPSWFATPDDQFTSCGYEGEVFEPLFMVNERFGVYGPTPLIAAMRCYVASKLGDEVDLPKEFEKCI